MSTNTLEQAVNEVKVVEEAKISPENAPDASNEPKLTNYQYFVEAPAAAAYSAGQVVAPWALLAAGVALLGTLATNPAMLPFGLTQVGFYSEAAIAAAATLGGGYSLSNRSRAGVAAAIAGLIAAVTIAAIATPTMLPFGLAALAAYSLSIKAAVAVAATAATVLATKFAATGNMSFFAAAPKSNEQDSAAPQAKVEEQEEVTSSISNNSKP